MQHFIDVYEGKAEKKPEFLPFYDDPKFICKINLDVLNSLTLYIREVIFEEVRVQFFPQLPSRQRCLWIIPNIDGVNYWKNLIHGNTLKLKITGKIHQTNEIYLRNETYSLNIFRQNAFKYWAGISGTTTLANEILFEGFIEVIEIINQ